MVKSSPTWRENQTLYLTFATTFSLSYKPTGKDFKAGSNRNIRLSHSKLTIADITMHILMSI